jgi:tRNA dimethylallyltransferase
MAPEMRTGIKRGDDAMPENRVRPGVRSRALVILGPTASGKTAVALEVARLLGGEIISADSRQAYRGLEIGTAAPTSAERASLPHHGVAFLEPGERYGAGRFARLARGWITEIEGRGAVPIVAGGTGFFVRALTDPVFDEPVLEPGQRVALERWVAENPLDKVRRWVERLDPQLTDRLGVVDRQRAARALELSLLTGRSLTWWQRNGPAEAGPIAASTWVLEIEASALRDRIGERTQKFLEGGWLEEVEGLLAAGHGPDSPAMSSIGYTAVLDLLSGRTSREAAVEAILRDTWRYARRQRTWLRHQVPRDAKRVNAMQEPASLAERIAADWRER